MATTKATELAQFAKTLTVDSSGNTTVTGTMTAPMMHVSGGGTFVDSAEVSGLIDSAFTAKSTDNLSEGSNLYYTDARADARVNLQTGANLDLSSKSTADLSEGSNLYYTTARADSDAKAAISVTDAGGDGSLSYSSGTITYTGPSASEVRAHFSAGTGVSISSGEVSIGQSVGTTDDVTYASVTADSATIPVLSGNITMDGVLYGPSTFYIDPAPVDSDAGTLVIRGNLQVEGTETIVNSTTVSINDKNIVLADSAANAAEADGAGITVNGASATITYDAGNDEWDFNKPINIPGGTTTGNVSFGDGHRAYFGAGNDLEIFSDGNTSYIKDNGTGDLQIRGADIALKTADGTESYLLCSNNGAVRIYYDNSKKLETTSGGIDVTGTVTFDGGTTSADLNFGDNDKAVFGTGNDLKIYHDGSNSYVQEGGTGSLYLLGQSQVVIGKSDATATYAAFNNTGSVDLYFNNAKKLATKSDGVDITGELQADSLDIDGSGDISGSVSFGSSITVTGQILSGGSIKANGQNNFDIYQNTSDASDTKRTRIGGGGDVQDARGAFIEMHGNEYSGPAGKLYLHAGNVSGAEVVVNELSRDTDFRVESNNNTHMLFVDGGNDRVGIGTTSPNAKLQVNGNTNISGWIKPELIQHMYDPTGATNTPAGYASATSSAWTLSFVNNDSNYPGSYGTILSMIDSNNNYGYSWQLFKGSSTENLYLRTGGSNAWSGWRKLWHEGNDGSGSGLDADTLDGVQGSNYLRSNTSDTLNGVLTVNTNSDYQIILTSSDTWTGFLFNDAGSNNDYIWHNGTHSTFAIGGGGSSVSGKKLHIDGGTTIGSSLDYTSVSSNGLHVQGNIKTDGTAVASTNTASKAAGSHQPDMGTYQNFVWTLTGNITLSNQAADYIGQTGFFVFIQDGTGSRTVSLGSAYETVSGGGLTLSSAGGSTDIVPYVYAASGRILLGTPQLAFS